MHHKIQAVAKQYEKSLDRLKADERTYSQSLLDAYREGMTWDDVARIAGLDSGNQARLRAMRAKSQDELPPSRRRESAAQEASPESPGVSVEAAAKHLGVSKPTVYKRIDRGELRAVTDIQGRTRVLFED